MGFTLLSWRKAMALLLAGSACTAAIDLDVTDPASIKTAAATVAKDLMALYTSTQPNSPYQIGAFPYPPFFWWESGAAWGTMVNYWHLTGDDQYNSLVSAGLLFQVGPNRDYMPPDEAFTLGNDDQGFWGMSAMLAAESNFPNPPSDQPQWLALAQAVFNSQALRWDNATCNGGLRWQIYQHNGFDYKNSIANGILFNLGARLAKYTGNSTYSDWSESVWEWSTGVGNISPQYTIYDGTNIETNCTNHVTAEWSYNYAVWLHGAAAMYNLTGGAEPWGSRINGILNMTIATFFSTNPSGVMIEPQCQNLTFTACNSDALSYRAYLSRFMAQTTQLAPFTYNTIMPLLGTSAKAAALQCSGTGGTVCGSTWIREASWDGTTGLGQQMSALEVIQSNLISQAKGPVSNTTGGTSQGNPSAGTGPLAPIGEDFSPLTTGDRVGAGILTTISCGMTIFGLWFMFT